MVFETENLCRLTDSRLSWGILDDRRELARSLLGKRLYLWPTGKAERGAVAVISSRQERGGSPLWWAALRQACAAATSSSLTSTGIVTTSRSYTDRLVSRAAHRTGCPVWRIDLPRPREHNLGRWLRRFQRSVEKPALVERTIRISPRLDGVATELQIADRDAATGLLADTIFVCGVRKRGHIDQLLRFLLEHPCPAKQFVVFAHEELIHAEMLDRLLAHGAKSKTLPAEETELDAALNCENRPRPTLSSVFPRSDYLIHCTRAPRGPWPLQTETEFLDEQLDDSGGFPRTAFGALQRIVAHLRIYGSSQAIRGGSRVVCMTSLALERLSSQRTFRAHRFRWDFEPYGIAIRRDRLEQQGACPVLYGHEAEWKQTPANQRWRFQCASSRKSNVHDAIDWTSELEWRVPGDVLLEGLNRGDAFCFVPTVGEAELLRPTCRWPVIVVS